MFTSIVSAMDISGRQKLADVVEYCHTRRALGLDSRALPVLFYQLRDHVLQQMATDHLQHIRSTFPQCRLCGRLRCPYCSHLYNEYRKSHTPLNDSKILTENSLLSIMDEETKKEYILAKFYGNRRETIEVGYRYLLHLTYPDKPLKETIRQLPPLSPEDEARIAAARAQHSDDEYFDDDDSQSDYEDSFYSEISDMTYETTKPRPQEYFWTDDSERERGNSLAPPSNGLKIFSSQTTTSSDDFIRGPAAGHS